jgi:hypothetical protein
MTKRWVLAALIGVGALGSLCAQADTLVTYTLTNVDFLGGGDATGTLTYDASDFQVTGWNIDAFNRHGTEIASFTNANSSCELCGPLGVLIGDNHSAWTLDLTFLGLLGTSPKDVGIGFGFVADRDILAYHSVDKGTLDPTVAPVPLPPTLGLLMGGLALLGVAQWRRLANLSAPVGPSPFSIAT